MSVHIQINYIIVQEKLLIYHKQATNSTRLMLLDLRLHKKETNKELVITEKIYIIRAKISCSYFIWYWCTKFESIRKFKFFWNLGFIVFIHSHPLVHIVYFSFGYILYQEDPAFDHSEWRNMQIRKLMEDFLLYSRLFITHSP